MNKNKSLPKSKGETFQQTNLFQKNPKTKYMSKKISHQNLREKIQQTKSPQKNPKRKYMKKNIFLTKI